MIFIERILYTVISDGLSELIADPELYEKFILGGLSYSGMSQQDSTRAKDEASRARAAFEANPPTVVHGFARVDGVFPCFAIVLGGESTEQDYLGEDAMDSYLDEDERLVYLDEDGNRSDPHVRRWGHNFDIYTYADHPDLCLYYYYLAKQILVEAGHEFRAADLDEITLNGADMAPDMRYLPSGMFVRRLGMKLSSDQEYFGASREWASSIRGIHVAENSSDATGVDALVTIGE